MGGRNSWLPQDILDAPVGASGQNTRLARRLAGEYERITGRPFPGGIENARIQRSYPGHRQRAEGAWSWCLETIEGTIGELLTLADFGSITPATEAIKDPDHWLEAYSNSHTRITDSERGIDPELLPRRVDAIGARW